MNRLYLSGAMSKRAALRLASMKRGALVGAILASVCSAEAGTLGVFTSDSKGFDTHTYYYDDGKEVVVFDTQFLPALTEKMVQQIHSQTASPITRVIVTHPNPDKFNGLAYLHGLGAVSISSRAIADDIPAVNTYKADFWIHTMKAFEPGQYPKLENIQKPFNGESTTLTLASGETITLFALKHAGVASHQLAARIDTTGDLIVGDLVHHNAHAWLEGGLVGGKPVPSIDSWIAALDELPALSSGHPLAKVYGGRGDAVAVTEAVHAQQEYLRRAALLTKGYVNALGARRDELKSPKTAGPHYAALEQRFTEAYPNYRLPYMIRYSIYGLMNAYAAQAGSIAGDGTPAQLKVEQVFDQAADVVWNKLGRFCSITQWQSLVASCVSEERSDGYYRTVVMKNDSAYVERLDSFSHSARSFQYSILSGPLPVSDYVSRFEILPVNESRSRLVWQAWYQQPAQNAVAIASDLDLLYRNGVRGMLALLAQ